MGWGAVLGLAALALALLLQHGFDMQPCAWCVLQRLVLAVLVVVFAAGALLPGLRAQAVAAAVALLLSLAGLAAASHQQWVASKSESCVLTFADRIIMALDLHRIADWMFMPYASCAQANLPWLGVPFAVWAMGLFIALGGLAVLALRAIWRRAAWARSSVAAERRADP